MINLAEELVIRSALAVNGKLNLDYQGTQTSLERPWRREYQSVSVSADDNGGEY
jgi:lysyl-tRNA synthetase class 2